jgi:hypothetical protein
VRATRRVAPNTIVVKPLSSLFLFDPHIHVASEIRSEKLIKETASLPPKAAKLRLVECNPRRRALNHSALGVVFIAGRYSWRNMRNLLGRTLRIRRACLLYTLFGQEIAHKEFSLPVGNSLIFSPQ